MRLNTSESGNIRQNPVDQGYEPMGFEADRGPATVDIIQLFSLFLRGWLIIGFTVAAALVLAIIHQATTTPSYKAMMVLLPAENRQTGGAESALNKTVSAYLGGNFGETSNDLEAFKLLLTSTVVSQKLIEEHPNLMPFLFADSWDKTAEEWRAPDDLSSIIKRGIKALIGMPAWREPNKVDLAGYLSRSVKVRQDNLSGMIEVSMVHSDPEFARRTLTILHRTTDDLVRQTNLRRSEERMQFMNSALPSISVTSQRELMIYVMGEEMQRMVVAEADTNYVAEIVIPPELPLTAETPRPRLVLPLAVIVGFIAGLILILAIDLTVGLDRARVFGMQLAPKASHKMRRQRKA